MWGKAYFHLPGLFEFYELYQKFLPLFFEHRNWFYDWAEIGSIYGAPADCIWGGGRVGFGQNGLEKSILELSKKYNISVRLTFSNSLLEEIHLSDKKCNYFCRLFESPQNGLIVHSNLLLEYVKKNYPQYQLISSTTKVLLEEKELVKELQRPEFNFVVPDFRFNPRLDFLSSLPSHLKKKVEFLCNECCWFECSSRKECYQNVSRKVLGIECEDYQCKSPFSLEGYKFSRAMENPGFIGIHKIKNVYMPMGFNQFKIEGRSLGSAIVLEFLLYYLTKPKFQLEVREQIYLDNSLDLF